MMGLELIGGAIGTFGIVAIVFGIILALLWMVLPFAVFGLKDLLRGLNTKLTKTNEYLDAIHRQNLEIIDALRTPSEAPSDQSEQIQ